MFNKALFVLLLFIIILHFLVVIIPIYIYIYCHKGCSYCHNYTFPLFVLCINIYFKLLYTTFLFYAIGVHYFLFFSRRARIAVRQTAFNSLKAELSTCMTHTSFVSHLSDNFKFNYFINFLFGMYQLLQWSSSFACIDLSGFDNIFKSSF